MAFLGLVDRTEVEAFATTLAKDLGRRFPPDSQNRMGAGTKCQLAVIFDGLGSRAVRFRDEKRPDPYKTSMAGNVFRRTLEELGYGIAFVGQVTTAIVRLVARR